jgi:hypothetical protein
MNEIERVAELNPGDKKVDKSSRIRKMDSEKLSGSLADRVLFLQRTIGNQAVEGMVRSGTLQAKLSIGQPGDKYEQEADRIADDVMLKFEAPHGAHNQMIPDEEKVKDNKQVQKIGILTTDHETHNGVLHHAEEAISAASTSNGQPLPANLHSKFEQALGVDLGSVRIHTDQQSEKANEAINSKAYTIGSDIHFNTGRYNPDSSEGQHLLAHEVVHTVQQVGRGAVQYKLIQAADSEDDKAIPLPTDKTASAPSAGSATPTTTLTTTPTTVNTLWNINFIDQFAGTGTKVEGRKETTSLYVKQLKVAPEGEAGKSPPPPKIFAGVTLAATGRSEMGSFAHPKDKGGKVSSSVAYGGKPKFDFTIKTVDYNPRRAEKEEKEEAARAKAMNTGAAHRAVIKELMSELDTFVDEQEAQAVLTRIVTSRFENLSVEAIIKMTSPKTTTPINTTDYDYSLLSADKTFNLVVRIPNVTRDKSSSYTTTKGSEVTKGVETSKEEGKEKGVATKSTIETEFIQSFESAFMNELKTAAEKVKTSANIDEKSTTHTGKMTVKNSTSAKLSGDINGEAGLDLSKIPLAGKILGKLLSAKVNISLKPDLSDTFELEHSSTDEEAKKTIKSEETKVRNELATAMQTSVKNLWSSRLKTSVETSTNEITTEKSGEKKSEGDKTDISTSSTSTSGTVTIVAHAVQPVLSEE